MDRLERAVAVLHEIDMESGKRSSGSRISPFSRLMVTLIFIIVTVSFGKYNLVGLSGMFLFLLMLSIWEDISLLQGMKRCRFIIFLLIFVGIANPFFDRTPVAFLGNFAVTGGMISMVTLFMKGLLTVCAVYFLMVQIGINGICASLSALPIPKAAVTVLLLMYRYLMIFLKEFHKMSQAYRLRCPKGKGIRISAWGSFVGLLLLRSIDRANDVYDSMKLRGYDGNFRYEAEQIRERASIPYSIWYTVCWTSVFLFLRFVPVFDLVGNLILGLTSI